MCGITGIYAFNQVGAFYMINLSKATASLGKRGPDISGTYLDMDNNLGLGHTRLSILDPTARGKQPFTDESGRYTIVFNGEIYNFRKLKSELEASGFSFKTETDTEVLLYLYIKEGEAALKMLNGFFAFAIYDKAERELFLARDRVGIKPLLFSMDNDKFIFASEMKAILNFNIEKQIDPATLALYTHFNYIPAPDSMLKNVQKLLPGQYMKVNKKALDIQTWYTIPEGRQFSGGYEEQKQQLKQVLDESVEERLISDVPLGAFLSGGTDSSVIVALASQKVDKLQTFSIGYKDNSFFDETAYANAVAKKFNTDHTVFSLTSDDLYEHLFEMLDYMDEPFADSSALAYFILSSKTKGSVKVALSGDGADELFAGYNKHKAEYLLRSGSFPAKSFSAILPLLKILPASRNSFIGNKVRQAEKILKGGQMSAHERYFRWAGFTGNDNDVFDLFSEEMKEQMKDSYHERKNTILHHIKNAPEDFDALLRTDVGLVLANDMLQKADLMSMAHGLEVRVPFLSQQVVDFTFSIPTSSKIDSKMRKKILQDSFRDILPAQLYNRPKKGFEVPLLDWMRNQLKPLITDELLSEDFVKAQGIFNYRAVSDLLNKLFGYNPGDAHARVWGLLVFQYWYRKNFPEV